MAPIFLHDSLKEHRVRTSEKGENETILKQKNKKNKKKKIMEGRKNKFIQSFLGQRKKQEKENLHVQKKKKLN